MQDLEEGLTNEGRHHLQLLHKQVHDKSNMYINRTSVTVCEVGIFSREISQLSEIRPLLSSLRSHLHASSSPMGVFSRLWHTYHTNIPSHQHSLTPTHLHTNTPSHQHTLTASHHSPWYCDLVSGGYPRIVTVIIPLARLVTSGGL